MNALLAVIIIKCFSVISDTGESLDLMKILMGLIASVVTIVEKNYHTKVTV
jgi:hypothetical protein